MLHWVRLGLLLLGKVRLVTIKCSTYVVCVDHGTRRIFKKCTIFRSDTPAPVIAIVITSDVVTTIIPATLRRRLLCSQQDLCSDIVSVE